MKTRMRICSRNSLLAVALFIFVPLAGKCCSNYTIPHCSGPVINAGICRYPGGPHPIEDQSARGWIINNTKQAVSIEVIDYEGRVLKSVHLFSGEPMRIARLFNTVTKLRVNGQIFDRCFVLGMEKDTLLSNRHNKNVVLISLLNSFPYVRCVSPSEVGEYLKFRYELNY